MLCFNPLLTALCRVPLYLSLAEVHETEKNVEKSKATMEGLISALESLLAPDTEGESKIHLPFPSSKDEIQGMFNLACIEYMKFVRRAEGIKGARLLFSRFRKSPHCTFHLYLYSAFMEYHCSKDKSVAGKIFEVGMKSFGEDAVFVHEYLKFLIEINEENSSMFLFFS